MTFDFTHGCSGFVYGLFLAKSIIYMNQADCVLLICSETYSKYISNDDRQNLSIFGDAGSAIIIEKSQNEEIGSFKFYTDGNGAKDLIVKNKNSYDLPDFSENKLYMNGPALYTFTLDVVPKLVSEVLQSNSLDFDDIDYFVFHQANKYMLQSIAKKISIPEEKFILDFSDCGNTVSSSIPIVLKRSLDKKIILKNKNIMIIGFGVGLSAAGTVIKF